MSAMRYYDHLVRAFTHTGQGDFRTAQWPFSGGIPSQTQMFSRCLGCADVAITNCPIVMDHAFRGPGVLSTVGVDMRFATTDEDTLSAAEMESLCLTQLSVEVRVFPYSEDRHAAVTAVGSHQAPVAFGGEHVEALGNAAPFSVVVRQEQVASVFVHIGDELREHLNGFVRRNGTWVPGDPRMERIVRVSVDWEPGSRMAQC